MRKDQNKAGPSGDSRNNMFLMPEKWGGRDCLEKIAPEDMKIIQKLKNDIGGEALLHFVTPEYAARAEVVYQSLNIQEITLENIWFVFEDMLAIM